ncbi:MAG: FAD-dependent oxidoreductase [Candidatus Obscuribacterales bacterium]|nr:FAD-dependent oxidoreductase [Candidatus Obscuribacterales bacterium]
MSKLISRAAFLRGALALGALGLAGKSIYERQSLLRQIPCRVLGPSRGLGHKLRDGVALLPGESKDSLQKKVLIIGAGIAGLSAAWWLKRNGFSDFVLIELEKHAGGNAASGRNEISAYPWGAHYVPLANEESKYVRLLFEELGIISSYDQQSLPLYNELYLCHEPQEKLFKDGSFQEGLVPKRGLQPKEKDELSRFFALVAELRSKIGKDSRPAFAIPLDQSSQDEEYLQLDRISMAEWLKENRFSTRPLLWYVNYCCRDDYGSSIDNVSAWAALHYFAGRRGKAGNAEMNSVVTWPEGNGFLVESLRKYSEEQIMTATLAARIIADGDRLETLCLKDAGGKELCIKSSALIFSAPRFLAQYLIQDHEKHNNADSKSLVYAPWLVANVSLRQVPSCRSELFAWDNVDYYSDSLGYVMATHQNISTRTGATVLTYYYPMSAEEPMLARRKLLNLDEKLWSEKIIADLERLNPGIRSDILSIDFWPWGHGMIRPSVGYIWGENRRKMKENSGQIFFAHSDMSGISNFEEAQYHGVEAAKAVLAKFGQS